MGAWKVNKINTIGDYRAQLLQTLCEMSDEYAMRGMTTERSVIQAVLTKVHEMDYNIPGALQD